MTESVKRARKKRFYGQLVRDAIRNAVSEVSLMKDMDSIATIVARAFDTEVSLLQRPKTIKGTDKEARQAAMALMLRFTKESNQNILVFFNYNYIIDKRNIVDSRPLRMAARYFDDLIDEMLREAGINVPPRQYARESRVEAKRKRKMKIEHKRRLSLMVMLNALKAWDIDDAFTHIEDFCPRQVVDPGRAGRISTLERLGLVESEVAFNDKWYRLTETGRIALQKEARGVALAKIFDGLKFIKKKSIQEIADEQKQQAAAA